MYRCKHKKIRLFGSQYTIEWHGERISMKTRAGKMPVAFFM